MARAGTRAERELHVHPVDPRHARVADDLDRSRPGDELAELLERARLDVDAAGGQHDAVDVVGARVGDLVVDRATLLVELPKRRFVLGERPFRPAHPLPGSVDRGIEQHRHRALAEQRSRGRREHRTAAQRDHDRLRRLEHPGGEALLGLAKRAFAALEELRDRRARLPLDLDVEIQEAPSQAVRHRSAERRLARAHEADERDVPVQRVRHAIRSR